jgi:hypothetical protein
MLYIILFILFYYYVDNRKFQIDSRFSFLIQCDFNIEIILLLIFVAFNYLLHRYDLYSHDLVCICIYDCGYF